MPQHFQATLRIRVATEQFQNPKLSSVFDAAHVKQGKRSAVAIVAAQLVRQRDTAAVFCVAAIGVEQHTAGSCSLRFVCGGHAVVGVCRSPFLVIYTVGVFTPGVQQKGNPLLSPLETMRLKRCEALELRCANTKACCQANLIASLVFATWNVESKSELLNKTFRVLKVFLATFLDFKHRDCYIKV